ncbi:MAG TPA: outer membrane protein assembly factor BamC [Xanthomonadales bacterium]|nr:outer membrane protein assembly factor BamC [Xanthomonadales bacterium]
MSKAVVVGSLVLAACVALAGCGMFGGNKREAYEGSRAGRPLEVPPDLDAPATSRSLVIPAAGAAAGDSQPPSDASPSDGAPIASSPSAIEPGTASSLKIGDAPAGAWRRVGLALERSGVGEILARDEAAGTYTVKSTVTEREGGLLSRMIGRDKVSVSEATRVVRIVADGDGSEIRVEDESGEAVEDAAARKLIAAIRQRLG